MEFIDKIKIKLLHYTWCIAYGHYDESIMTQGIDVSKLHIVKNPYKEKWFADPFILEEDEQSIHFLVEEFDKKVGRGRIAHVIVDKQKDVITDCVIVLEQPTHLSFPAIYRMNGKTYVHPENYASGKSYIYEYERSSDSLIDPIEISDNPLTDAIITKESGSYKLYATLGTNPNGSELSVYVSDSFFGPYKEKLTEQYPNNTARMAGYMVTTKDGIVRPAQNCEGAYGKNVVFYKDKRVIGKIFPWGIYSGLHTFNTYGSSFVIDLKKYDYPLVYKMKNLV